MENKKKKDEDAGPLIPPNKVAHAPSDPPLTAGGGAEAGEEKDASPKPDWNTAGKTLHEINGVWVRLSKVYGKAIWSCSNRVTSWPLLEDLTKLSSDQLKQLELKSIRWSLKSDRLNSIQMTNNLGWESPLYSDMQPTQHIDFGSKRICKIDNV